MKLGRFIKSLHIFLKYIISEADDNMQFIFLRVI